MNCLEREIRAQGMEVFARIDHASGAAAAGLKLAPMELIIFGNSRAGTPLMQIAPTVGIDLPMKALVWQDATGQVWLSYTDPDWIARRHGVGADGETSVQRMNAALSSVVRKATDAS
ncbi:MAG: DUF302 domain-containing protein [Chthoniobacteraceae bacterium]